MSPERTSSLYAVGVMTGNSLDGIDCVLTRFDQPDGITDLKFHHADMPEDLVAAIRSFRQCVENAHGNMDQAVAAYEKATPPAFKTFDELLRVYNKLIADAVGALLKKAKRENPKAIEEIDLIGMHGQTCAHCPPSIAKSRDPKDLYTVQIADGQALADLTGITVVFDFRSDDIMNGGEGAPLAPMHHAHLARHLKTRGYYPLALCNAGNTGNISVLTTDKQGHDIVLGWDTGPFNHFSDELMRREKNTPFDRDGEIGARGKVNIDLLAKLFSQAVVTKDGTNFLNLFPPKSSDPTWYVTLPELLDPVLPFEDRLRTVQYFSAYLFVQGLTSLAKNLELPLFFVLCGGGWKNRTVRTHFCDLLQGDLSTCPILPSHKQSFQQLRSAIDEQIKNRRTEPALSAVVIADSESFGYDGTAMEARLMADAAVSRVKAIPFSRPSTTGTASDTVLGIIRFPSGQLARASDRLKSTIEEHESLNLTIDLPAVFDRRWSRASAGWYERLIKSGSQSSK
jgi:anhydro-N-acetylmuramic acid kinase